MSTTQPSGQLAALTLAALGVVYGDIGTSPLYTIREIFANPHYPVPITPDNILGMLSLVLWSLVIVVALKYVTVIMRADNKGEGGIMALMALVMHHAKNRQQMAFLMVLGLFGAALFYGDSVITPAISVLSAIEGLEVAAPALKPYIVPLSLLVLIALFIMQKHGTGRMGSLFGPIIVVWFVMLALLGLVSIFQTPLVLRALNPWQALGFFLKQPLLGFLSLGASVLAITGGEALYADMGHFGRRPIQLAWFGLVLPSLVLNYFGQGALLLREPQAIANPFYLLAPDWALIPMVVLATLATVIASQAVISGAYSLTRQAIQLGYVPRMDVQHTSSKEIGQIYLPAINWTLLAAVALLVIGFGSSGKLASAYGIAVTGTMVITTILTFIVARQRWHWHPLKCNLILGGFLLVDIVYFSANSLKVFDGGWFPLTMGLMVFIVMTTWKRGRQLVHDKLAADGMPLEQFVELMAPAVPRVQGTAVFMSSDLQSTPHALLHSMKHYKSLHERVVILTAETADIPYIPMHERVTVEAMGQQFYRVKVVFGFMDEADIPAALAQCERQGLRFDMMDTSFFLGRETLIPKVGAGVMGIWREKLFLAMFRNASAASAYFKLPTNRVVELGSQLAL
ncbi:K+ potassium transporter [Pseudogulbenkiania sp. NH8B]|uniref:potassium transporter Kup n=1 Tax=Pseudogulbenkiania sp. (strain NH8B) TaxID=748280 RepID=UPI0002279BC9|nr:potassium transporter Kup [Pseudogulbenkiania sp. NH8B]BAK76948.1 K+ potassium transporter [Pseudogulbenkiania sp. NH8B]